MEEQIENIKQKDSTKKKSKKLLVDEVSSEIEVNDSHKINKKKTYDLKNDSLKSIYNDENSRFENFKESLKSIDQLINKNNKNNVYLSDFNNALDQLEILKEKFDPQTFSTIKEKIMLEKSTKVENDTKFLTENLKSNNFVLTGEFPEFSLIRKDDLTKEINKNVLYLTIIDDDWTVKFNKGLENESSMKTKNIVDDLINAYNNLYYNTINEIEMFKVFHLALAEASLFKKDDNIELYLKDFFAICEQILIKNNYLPKKDFVKNSFENEFKKLADKLKITLQHARDTNMFVKLTIDGFEVEYSYIVCNKKLLWKDEL